MRALVAESALNLFEALPDARETEAVSGLVEAGTTRIERIVSHGQASPKGFWYDQDETEWVIVLSGSARLEFEDRELGLGPGDHVEIPAHTRHRVSWTTPDEPTVWLAVFYADSRTEA